MKLPKFLIGDNSAQPDDLFVVHTEYPRFILDIDTEEVEWLDELKKDPETNLDTEVKELIEQAYAFFDNEIDQYEEEEESDL